VIFILKTDYYDWSEVIMGSSIKEIIIQFVFVFLVLFIIGYYIKIGGTKHEGFS